MSTAKKKQFSKLVDAYLKGKASSEGRAFIEQYYDLFSDGEDVFETMDEIEVTAVGDRLKARIDATLQTKEETNYILSWKYISVAATILLAAAMGIYFYKLNQTRLKATLPRTKMLAEISPGGNRAILTLSNRRKISLTDIRLGKIGDEQGVVIKKTKDGQLVYQVINSSGELAFNSVETPKGGQYQLSLSDGTQVWLNAASTLKYPIAFSGKERIVELNGEAYFEVAKNKGKRFVVTTAHQSVEVLGTHFNINSYPDELNTKTTLIEGSVKVINSESGKTAVIRPGQQALVSNDRSVVGIKDVDVDEAMAWRIGYFMFDEEPLESILRKVSRWYDVDILYQNSDHKKKLLFSGTISKYNNVSMALKKFELTGAFHFRIIGRKIIID